MHPGRQDGFTLIELLVTVIIIGVLAAIAIPMFLSQGVKGYDASAKSDISRLVKLIEACKVEEESYTKCDEQSEIDSGEEISWGTGEGSSGVSSATDDGYRVYSISKAKTDDKNHIFSWERDEDGVTTRFCLNSAQQPLSSGGCRNSAW